MVGLGLKDTQQKKGKCADDEVVVYFQVSKGSLEVCMERDRGGQRLWWKELGRKNACYVSYKVFEVRSGKQS